MRDHFQKVASRYEQLQNDHLDDLKSLREERNDRRRRVEALQLMINSHEANETTLIAEEKRANDKDADGQYTSIGEELQAFRALKVGYRVQKLIEITEEQNTKRGLDKVFSKDAGN